MTIKTNLLAFAACLTLAGCDTYTGGTYSPDMTDLMTLKHLPPANVTVGSFTGPSDVSLTCRLDGPIHIPGDIPPEQYISQSLAGELGVAGLSGGAGPGVTLTGNVSKFGFSSAMFGGNWQLAETVNSSNGKSVSVSTVYDFHSSYVADAACDDVASALEPAVQSLNEKLISDPGFPALLKN
jgi:hypothetical protein